MTSIDVISLTASEYPARLAKAPGAPDTLYLTGQLPALDPVVAVVGARCARGHSVALARTMAADLAEAGVLVVSGGAVGIDSAAHRGALDAQRPTLAVLAGGLDQAYPGRNRPLFAEIVAGGGGLLSMHRPGTPPRRGTFVARNQVIAALSDAVVVVEAESGSGSLHTAVAARRLGRPVLAVPGSPGCEALLACGAALAEGAFDVQAALKGALRRPQIALPEPGTREALALAALDRELPLAGGAIAKRAGLEPRDAARALAGLEIEGLALLLPGQTYLRSPLAETLMER